ncbi:hypothetical protein AK830_g8123 [Neonectria ditissima]|uniref:Uncharacterized protein n=1 Tax=Neonectria ditissima TaxID=78410 RepID=A0A0P7BDC8_9HYPO|nr:hypothetical protein AK830_g8123 [Neonectria ditissima]
MCYRNLGTLICYSCGRRVGEQPVGMSPCRAVCGKFVSRVTGAVVQGECGVCHQAKEERVNLAQRLNQQHGHVDSGKIKHGFGTGIPWLAITSPERETWATAGLADPGCAAASDLLEQPSTASCAFLFTTLY